MTDNYLKIEDVMKIFRITNQKSVYNNVYNGRFKSYKKVNGVIYINVGDRINKIARCKKDDNIIDRIERYSVLNKNTGCLEWIGYLTNGYASLNIKVDGKRSPKRVSRLIFEYKNGPINSNLFVCHKCDNPKCVNIDHLFLGTQKDNMEDCSKKGRTSKINIRKDGLAKNSRLTLEQVNKIRNLKGVLNSTEIAKQFGLKSRNTVLNIWNRKSWL